MITWPGDSKGLGAQVRRVLVGKGFGAKLARGGGLALLIRIASVGLSYLMFVVLARNMDTAEYGFFGFAFSLATFVAVVAGLGQRLLVLRFIPIYEHDQRPSLLRGLVRDSYAAVIVGSSVCFAFMLGAAFAWGSIGHADTAYMTAAGLLMLAMAIAQHQAYVIRAFGQIGLALLPRDVLWRMAVIGVALGAANVGGQLTAAKALYVCATTLLLVFVLQGFAHPATRVTSMLQSGMETDRSLWTKESVGLWGSTVIPAAIPNLSVVLLGLTLSPTETAPFFAAMKTATLLNLPLAAGAIVGAPLISRYYGAGQLRKVQKVSNYLVLGTTAPVLAAFLAIVTFGDRILEYFGPNFTSAEPALVLIAVGALVNALSGPTRFLMNMTGHHREYLVMITVTQITALAILPIAAIYFGILGAAVAVAVGTASWNFWVWWWSRKNLSIDPTFYGVVEWLIRRQRRVSDEKT